MGRRRGASHAPPPHVADWLERELEARGLDAAALYARYVISVLRAHHRDAAADEAPAARGGKEAGGPRKRPRRAPDADEIRRAAAVRCLRAASDQNYEIEALVDELCEKLKEVNNTASEASAPQSEETKKIPVKISPQELANKYYAAFPPLCPQSAHLVNFVPKWLPSTHNSPKKSTRRRPRRQPHEKYHSESSMKPRGQVTTRQRFTSLSRPKKDSRPFSRTFDDFDNWDFFAINNNLNVPPAPKAADDDQVVLEPQNYDDDVNMYDDLPVDISDLLNDSPNPHVAIMNLANMRDTGKKDFIQCGTNIISSIWSNNRDSISFDSVVLNATDWPDFGGKNDSLESEELFCSLPSNWSSNEDLFDTVTISLMKINHSKEASCFTEIIPKQKPSSKPLNEFSTSVVYRRNPSVEKDDLLTSERSHFKPINEKLEGKEYADGSTFVISNNLDKIEYKRSESGYMYVENELGQSKKYREYNRTSEVSFVLKFCVSQNDKACQTEDIDIEVVELKLDDLAMDKALDFEEALEKCCCGEKEDCFYHPTCLNEINWKYEAQTCDKCKNNNNSTWNCDWAKKSTEWDNENLRNIWNGGEVCRTCLRLNVGRSPISIQHSQLREDISQDGEQLLSDLSSLQKSYLDGPDEPVLSFDDRKRRRSCLDGGFPGPWSFATRLQEDCFITMSSLPTLRSVTL